MPSLWFHFALAFFLAFLFALRFFPDSRLLDSQSPSSANSDHEIMARYEEWIAEHGKVHTSSEEKQQRFEVFKKNVQHIEAANSRHNYNLSVNRFADMTNEEFMATHAGYKGLKAARPVTPFMYENATTLPSSVDWRTEGAVNPIRNQDGCEACWAFSTVAAVEGITKIKKENLPSLSEQELVDCGTTGNNNGCQRWYIREAFEFIKSKGLALQAVYPYQAKKGNCNEAKLGKPAASISGYQIVPPRSEKDLMKAVAFQPVSVAIDASGLNYQFHGNHVYDGPCGIKLDHAVLVVGYGEDSFGTKVWIVRNSWGETWGENGYFRMKKDISSKDGLCGITLDASYPII